MNEGLLWNYAIYHFSPTPRLSATLAVSSECLSSLPIITLLLKRRAVYTCCQRPFNTATPVLNCTVFLGNQDLVSKATRADIIYANTLHAWRRITMTKILRDRMELRIETHQVRQEHDSSVLFRVKQQFASWYSQPEARPPVGPHKWHELHLQSSPHLPCGFSRCRRCSLFEMLLTLVRGNPGTAL